jgi:hypothetical protein
MSETPQPYNVPAPEEIDELLKGDFGVNEAAPESSKVMEVGDHPDESSTVTIVRDPKGDRELNITDVLDFLSKGYFAGKFIDSFMPHVREFLKQSGLVGFDMEEGDHTGESSSTLEVGDRTGGNSEVMEEGENFIRPIVPKAWLPGAVYIDLYDDGWEVRQHPDPLDEDISSSGETADKSEELAMLRRLKNELAGTLQKIYIHADQIDMNNRALQEDSFGDDERRGIEILDRYLAVQIKDLVRRHLKVTLRVVSYDNEF